MTPQTSDKLEASFVGYRQQSRGPETHDLSLRRFAKCREKPKEFYLCLIDPLGNRDLLIHRRLKCECKLSLEVGVRSCLSDVNPTEFRARLQRNRLSAKREPGDLTIPLLRDFAPTVLGDEQEWSDCAMFIFVRQARKKGKDVMRLPTHRADVWLETTNDRDISTHNAWELRPLGDFSAMCN